MNYISRRLSSVEIIDISPDIDVSIKFLTDVLEKIIIKSNLQRMEFIEVADS
jgi:hypothetical protein